MLVVGIAVGLTGSNQPTWSFIKHRYTVKHRAECKAALLPTFKLTFTSKSNNDII